MPALNVLGTDPAFQLASLTAAVQEINYRPGRIGEMGLFAETPVTTLDVLAEERGGILKLLSPMERGAPPESTDTAARTVRSFRLPHIKVTDRVLADQLIGIRSFGSETEQETLAQLLAARMAPMVESIEYTIESHRLSAVMGNYMNAGGSAVSLFAEFGVSQQTVNFALGTNTTKVRTKCMDTIKKIEDALGGSMFSEVRVICGETFWCDLIEHDVVKDAYASAEAAAQLLGDPRLSFTYGGMTFERYRGTSAVKVPDAEAYAIPVGVSGLFMTAFGPADYIEAAGSVGQRRYAKQWPLEANRGIQLEVQSNPLSICTRPAAVIKLTRA